MTRERVQSSAIYAIGYDPAREALAVEFHANRAGIRRVFEYVGVTAEAYATLKAAPSLGRAFRDLDVRNNAPGLLIAEVDADGVETPTDAVLR